MKMAQAIYRRNQGWSNLPSPSDWNNSKSMIFAFCGSSYFDSPDELKKLHAQFPLASLIGCSTSGEIMGEELYDDSIVLTFASFSEAHHKVVAEDINNPEHSFDIGAKVAASFDVKNLKGILVFSEGLNVNGSRLITGVNSIIDTAKIPVGGGLAGDGTSFKRTFIIHNGEVKTNCVVAMGFYGESLHIGAASRGGWDIFGPEREVTRSSSNVLYELDNRPALDLYKEYLGDKAKDLPASGLLFPLQISSPDNSSKRLVRTILAVNEAEKSMVFAGDIPHGWKAQLMRANFDRLVDGAETAFQSSKKQINKEQSPELVFAISCVGRRLVLGERTFEEIEAISNHSSKDSLVTGFYSYGELAPFLDGNPCDLHNQSMTIFAICEHKAQPAKKTA